VSPDIPPGIPPGIPSATAFDPPVGASRLVRTGLAARARGKYSKAFENFAKAAATGEAEGQFRLGLLYARGEGVVGSLGDAIVWLRRAAEQGHGEAQYQLSLAYLHGGQADGGAPTWYNHAAAVDRDIADRNRALMFPNGIAVPPDPAEALHWSRAAAEQGLASAQANLASLYARGLGCEIDYAEARRWYAAAA
jgi:TPR repeat protein